MNREVVITGERTKMTRCVVFEKRFTKIRRSEAKLLGAQFDYIFGRARVFKTVVLIPKKQELNRYGGLSKWS